MLFLQQLSSVKMNHLLLNISYLKFIIGMQSSNCCQHHHLNSTHYLLSSVWSCDHTSFNERVGTTHPSVECWGLDKFCWQNFEKIGTEKKWDAGNMGKFWEKKKKKEKNRHWVLTVAIPWRTMVLLLVSTAAHNNFEHAWWNL